LVVTFDYNRRLISPEPKANRVELDRCEEAGGELVVAGGDDGSASAWRRPLDQVALAVEVHDWRSALVLDQLADTVDVVDLVREHRGARAEVIERAIGNLPVVGLSSG
jgi:hypothetical protein